MHAPIYELHRDVGLRKEFYLSVDAHDGKRAPATYTWGDYVEGRIAGIWVSAKHVS